MREWEGVGGCACVGDLHAGEGLEEVAQVLLKQSRVEVVKVRRDDRVLLADKGERGRRSATWIFACIVFHGNFSARPNSKTKALP